VSLLVGVGLDGLGKARIAQAFRMPSESMQPALLVGDYFFVDKRPAATHTPKRGDIVIYGSPADASAQFAKRVIGRPGETIEIRDQQVLIDGRALAEPYAVHLAPVEAADVSPRDNMARSEEHTSELQSLTPLPRHPPSPTRRPSDLTRGDIVIYGSPADASAQFAKRVIGRPGETIEIRDQQVLIDGRALAEPYAVHLAPVEAADVSPRDNMA